MSKQIYYRIIGEQSTLILTQEEMDNALDRESYGKGIDLSNSIIKDENEYSPNPQ